MCKDTYIQVYSLHGKETLSNNRGLFNCIYDISTEHYASLKNNEYGVHAPSHI